MEKRSKAREAELARRHSAKHAANIRTLRSDLRTALDVLRKAKKRAKPEDPRGGIKGVVTTLSDQNAVFFLRGSANEVRGAIPPAVQIDLLKHLMEAQSILAYLFESQWRLQFEEPEYALGEAIVHVSEALEIALGLAG